MTPVAPAKNTFLIISPLNLAVIIAKFRYNPAMKNLNFGVVITLIGGILWGFSGVCGQYLFDVKGVSADWLVPYRLLVAGSVLVAFYALRSPRILFAPILDRALLPSFLLYSIVGLMATQYSYFYSIELSSNAAVATVIQYTAPAMILAVVCLRARRWPSRVELVALVLATLGVVLLATRGDLGSFVMPPKALTWAFFSAICICVYNLAPARLNAKYPVALNLGWGMVLGGFVLALMTGVWRLDGVSDLRAVAAFAGVAIFGTIFAFSFYMIGVGLIGASKASMIACIEPVSAAIFGHFWLGTEFVFIDFVGFVLIISCIFLLSKKGKNEKFS